MIRLTHCSWRSLLQLTTLSSARSGRKKNKLISRKIRLLMCRVSSSVNRHICNMCSVPGPHWNVSCPGLPNEFNFLARSAWPKEVKKISPSLRATGSHSVTCHQTQVNAPRLNPSQVGRYSIYPPRRDERLSWPGWLVIYRYGLPVRRQSLIQVVSGRAYRHKAALLVKTNALNVTSSGRRR